MVLHKYFPYKSATCCRVLARSDWPRAHCSKRPLIAEVEPLEQLGANDGAVMVDCEVLGVQRRRYRSLRFPPPGYAKEASIWSSREEDVSGRGRGEKEKNLSACNIRRQVAVCRQAGKLQRLSSLLIWSSFKAAALLFVASARTRVAGARERAAR